jgi:hypothetical protein
MEWRRVHVPMLAVILLLTACSRRHEEGSSNEPVNVAPDSAGTSSGSTVAADSPGPHVNDPAVINFAGFGPAKFGANEEAVRMAWGQPLTTGSGAEGSPCRLLAMDPQPDNGRGIWFMLDDGLFVRYDVDVPLHVAPGNIVVGDSADAVRAAFAGRIEERPLKYVEGGKELIVSPPDGRESRLVFEVGVDGKVMNWRIGMPPQVFYVEGCG